MGLKTMVKQGAGKEAEQMKKALEASKKPKKKAENTSPKETPVSDEMVATDDNAIREAMPQKTEKKSKVGRKAKKEKDKKKQMVLTLTPDTYNKLLEWADSKPRSAPNYVSDFVEEHLKDILK